MVVVSFDEGCPDGGADSFIFFVLQEGEGGLNVFPHGGGIPHWAAEFGVSVEVCCVQGEVELGWPDFSDHLRDGSVGDDEDAVSGCAELVDKVGEAGVEGGFAGEGDGILVGAAGGGFPAVRVAPGFVARESFSLHTRDCCNDLFWGEFGFAGDLVLHAAPAEEAALVAAKGGCHLDAAPAFDSVELVFVALFSSAECPFAPHAGFDGCGGVFGDEVVSLAVKGVLGGFGW